MFFLKISVYRFEKVKRFFSIWWTSFIFEYLWKVFHFVFMTLEKQALLQPLYLYPNWT